LGGEGWSAFQETRDRLMAFMEERMPGDGDLPALQSLKAHVRYSEAIAGIEVMGLEASDATFLDMPFYKTGQIRKDPISEADVEVVLDVLEAVNPTHIFVAGDLSDPHGTHRMCYEAIKRALERYRTAASKASAGGDGSPSEKTPGEKTPGEKTPSKKAAAEGPRAEEAAVEGPRVWLYRGAWQEWEIDRADIFLPLTKSDLDRKVEAIFKHESQKDRAMFPGAYDEREFWQRARDRNRNTADTLNRLGLPEFYAAEAFVTTYDMP
jgi:glucosamine-6-phosphate deaminase